MLRTSSIHRYLSGSWGAAPNGRSSRPVAHRNSGFQAIPSRKGFLVVDSGRQAAAHHLEWILEGKACATIFDQA